MSSWVELKGWVSLNINSFNFISGGVEFGNNNVLVILNFSCKFFPDWGKFLAVTAPWGVELNEDIGITIEDDLFEVLSDKSLNGFTVLFWDVLTLKEGLEVSALEFSNELFQGINCEFRKFTWEGEFLHVVCWVKKSDCW